MNALMLTEKVAQLRSESVNESRLRHLTKIHPMMARLIDQLTDEFAEIDRSYQIQFLGRDQASVSSARNAQRVPMA